MVTKNYTIRGKVIDRNTERGIPNLRIETWDNELKLSRVLKSDETDGDGQFQVVFTDKLLNIWFRNRKIELFFRIYHEERAVHSTQNEITWSPNHRDEIIIIPVELGDEIYLVSGYVRTEDKRPIPNFLVEAFDNKVGQKPRSLGKTKTDENGRYEINYSDKATRFLENQHADLFVRVYDAENVIIAKSNLLVNAPAQSHINLAVPTDVFRGPSEYEELHALISTLVKPEDLKTIKQDDIKNIKTKLNLSLAKVERYIFAWKLLWNTDDYKQEHNIPPNMFYGLIRDIELLSLENLVNQSKERLQELLEQSIKSNVISIKFQGQINKQVEIIKEIEVAVKNGKHDANSIDRVEPLIKEVKRPRRLKRRLFDVIPMMKRFWANLWKK